MKVQDDLSKFRCKTIADMFRACNQFNVNADDLARVLLTTRYGKLIISGSNNTEYADSNFMLEGFVKFAKVKKCRKLKYSDEVLWYTGYLYKYWYDMFHTKAEKIYELAPVSKIDRHYDFFHTQDFGYVASVLMDGYYKK